MRFIKVYSVNLRAQGLMMQEEIKYMKDTPYCAPLIPGRLIDFPSTIVSDLCSRKNPCPRLLKAIYLVSVGL